MHSAAFQLSKVRRLIRTQGKVFYFSKPGRNEFGEPNGETVSHEIQGVFHEALGFASGYATKTTSEDTTIRKKDFPMVLTLWESLGELRHTDVLIFNGKSYRVNEIKNVAEANLIANISLEEVQTNGSGVQV